MGNNSRLNERELGARIRDEVHEHEQPSRFSRTWVTRWVSSALQGAWAGHHCCN